MTRRSTAVWVRLALAVMLVLTSTTTAAHRVTLAPTGFVDLSAYTLPDGSLPWICAFDPGDQPGETPPTACEFRVLAAIQGALPAPPVVTAAERPAGLTATSPAPGRMCCSRPAATRPHPRAPPSS